MTNDAQYYISTGAKDAMYTLRYRYTETVWVKDPMGRAEAAGTRTYDYFIRNLSTDADTAAAKAAEIVGAPVPAPDFTLDEIHRRNDEQMAEAVKRFQGGKYRGQDAIAVSQTDMAYCLWFIRARRDSTRDARTVEYLMTDAAVRTALEQSRGVFQFGKHKGERIAEVAATDPSYCVWYASEIGKTDKAAAAAVESIPAVSEHMAADTAAAMTRREILKPLSQILLANTEYGSFGDDMAREMAAGNMPRGRALEIVPDMIARFAGRRNSKAYKAELERVTALLEQAAEINA